MIPSLPTDVRQIAFDNVLWEVRAIHAKDRAGPLAALSGILIRLPDNDEQRKSSYESIMRAIREIPADQRSAPLEEQSSSMSIAFQSQDERKNAFDELVVEIRNTPAKSRLNPFVVLSRSIETLALGDLQGAFDTMVDQVDEPLSSEHQDRLGRALMEVHVG